VKKGLIYVSNFQEMVEIPVNAPVTTDRNDQRSDAVPEAIAQSQYLFQGSDIALWNGEGPLRTSQAVADSVDLDWRLLKHRSFWRQAISEPSQLPYGYFEGRRYSPHGSPGRICLTSLDQRKRAGRYAGLVCKVFLGKTALGTKLADRFAEGGLGLIGAAHRTKLSNASVMS
jgi:hypothetical protein